MVSDLSVLLAIMPTALWLWWQGQQRWPRAMIPINGLGLGAGLWFFTERVWTDWRPFWEAWMAGLPLVEMAGWVALLGPLTLWLWMRSTQRWPLPFTALNLLLFGGLLGLVADRTHSDWHATWRYWAAGLPFVTFPIPVVIATPLSAWLWDRGTHRWPRVFIIPNLLLAGGFLWLVAGRTRPLWQNSWAIALGDLPVPVELPLLLFDPGQDNGGKPDWIYTGIGGGPWLIRNGQIDESQIRNCTNANPHSCRSTVAQTAVAISQDRRWLFLVVIKGQDASGTARFLHKQLQPWNAIKFDGGGSSQLWYGGQVIARGDGRQLSQYLAVIAEPGSGIEDTTEVPALSARPALPIFFDLVLPRETAHLRIEVQNTGTTTWEPTQGIELRRIWKAVTVPYRAFLSLLLR